MKKWLSQNKSKILPFVLGMGAMRLIMSIFLLLFNPPVKVEVTENNKVSKYTLEREDSLRKVWNIEKDSLKNVKVQYKTEVKVIYKESKDENTTINKFANRDSLWAVANKYIENHNN